MSREFFPKPKKVIIGNEHRIPEGCRWKITASVELASAARVAEDMLQKLIPDFQRTDGQVSMELRLETGFQHEQPEAYTLQVKEGKCTICGTNRNGVICGLATLRQMMMQNGAYCGSVPDAEITDWPDIRWRAASRWLIDLEGTRMAYDWGDGRENFLRRYREKIDFAMHHKINLAFFEGFTWELHKYPEYIEDIRSLNQYAAARNVALEFGGHCIGIGGRNPDFKDVTSCGFVPGLGDLNRHHYPDGEPYPCTGKSEDHPTRLNGACHSNELLNELKMKQLAEYVRLLEPHVLYLHPEDIGSIDILTTDWSFRCEECRKRWPSDLPETKDGAAGAQAYTLAKLYHAVCSVKNPESGYDGAKDCLCVIVPAAYACGNLSDPEFEQEITMYRNMAELLPKSENVLLLMREQFKRNAAGDFRVAEMAKKCPLGISVFAVNGADGYTSGRLFEPAALLNGFYAGAKMIFNFAGTLYQEPQEAFNAECCWNLPEVPSNSELMEKELISEGIAKLKALSEFFPDYRKVMMAPDGFISRFCKSFYGVETGEAIAEITRYGTSAEYPMVSMAFVFTKKHLFDGTRADMAIRTNLHEAKEQWRAIAEMTERAFHRLSAVSALPKNSWARESVLRFRDVLGLTMRVSRLIFELAAKEKDFPKMLNQLEDARQYLNRHFQFRFISEYDGEHPLWHSHLNRIERQIRKQMQNPIEN